MFLVANWKMNMTRDRIGDYLSVLDQKRLSGILEGSTLEVALAPTHVYLDFVSEEVRRRHLPVKVFAQDVSTRTEGAFTGEVGVRNIEDAGATGSILGHSERRRYFGETDAGVTIKTGLCLNAGIVPVVCFGESLEERNEGATLSVLRQQLACVADEVAVARKNGIDTPFFLAYEPVWAIGSGINASPDDIRNVLSAVADGFPWPEIPRFLYGGSVNLDNIGLLSGLKELSGFLVGGAWLDPDVFLESVKALR